MPNNCWNYIVFSGDKEDVEAFILEEFVGVPNWALDIKKRGQEAVYLKVWSHSMPDFVWLEGLLEKYPSCWIKNNWTEEGGNAGIWIGMDCSGKKLITRFDWHDMSIEEELHRFRELE
jgi:hypothetical protein